MPKKITPERTASFLYEIRDCLRFCLGVQIEIVGNFAELDFRSASELLPVIHMELTNADNTFLPCTGIVNHYRSLIGFLGGNFQSDLYSGLQE